MPTDVLNSKAFVNWAKGEIAANKLVIVSDKHNDFELRYLVYKNIVTFSKPGVLLMEVPYNHSNSLADLTDYWNNKGHQPRMVGVVAQAFNLKWMVENIDADMGTGKASMPSSNWETEGLRMGPARQKFMATNIQKAMKKAGANKGGLLIVGTEHVTGKDMCGIKVPMFIELLTFDKAKDAQKKKVIFEKNEVVQGYSIAV